VKEFQPFDDGELLHAYLNQAVWHWFDASTFEMRLKANFHRLAARCILDELRERGLEEPAEELVFARARTLFPPDDLRPL
jgi:hypothetical protein